MQRAIVPKSLLDFSLAAFSLILGPDKIVFIEQVSRNSLTVVFLLLLFFFCCNFYA